MNSMRLYLREQKSAVVKFFNVSGVAMTSLYSLTNQIIEFKSYFWYSIVTQYDDVKQHMTCLVSCGTNKNWNAINLLWKRESHIYCSEKYL